MAAAASASGPMCPIKARSAVIIATLRKLGQHHRPRELHSFVELDREVLASRPSRALPQN